MHKVVTDEDVRWLRKTRKITFIALFAAIINLIMYPWESVTFTCLYLGFFLGIFLMDSKFFVYCRFRSLEYAFFWKTQRYLIGFNAILSIIVLLVEGNKGDLNIGIIATVFILNAYFYFMWKSGFWNYMDRVVDNRLVLDM